MLNSSSVVPLYQQIINTIKDRVESGEYKPGQILPSEAQLCEEFGVSRITVRNAMKALVEEGMVIKHHGKGSFLRDDFNHKVYKRFQGFTAICRENNIPVYSHVLKLSQEKASPEISKILKLEPGEPVVYLERLRLANYKPVLIERVYLPYSRYAFLLKLDMENQSLYKQISENTDIDPEQNCTNDVMLEASIATSAEARELQIAEGSPLFVLKEFVATNSGEPVHFTKQLMVSNTFRFMLSTPENRLRIRLDG